MKVSQIGNLAAASATIVLSWVLSLSANAQVSPANSPPVKVFGLQQGGAASQPASAAPANAAPQRSSTSQVDVDAEREQIWNSPDMLRARAWLKDYCSKSAKVTPEMAKQYEAELANMTPNQMRIWLMKFDEEEQQRQQQDAMFQQHNEYMMQQALAAHRQTQQAYNAMNQASSEAAQNAQQQIDQQRQEAASAQENKQLNQTAPYYGGPYGFGGYGYGPYGFGAFGGGIHYHYHLYGK